MEFCDLHCFDDYMMLIKQMMDELKLWRKVFKSNEVKL